MSLGQTVFHGRASASASADATDRASGLKSSWVGWVGYDFVTWVISGLLQAARTYVFQFTYNIPISRKYLLSVVLNFKNLCSA